MWVYGLKGLRQDKITGITRLKLLSKDLNYQLFVGKKVYCQLQIHNNKRS